jgi:hypothetical protein
MKPPATFVGIDLTDSYANRPRDVDVAILRADLETGAADVEFLQFGWPDRNADNWAAVVARAVRAYGCNETVFIVDGPQALAAPRAGSHFLGNACPPNAAIRRVHQDVN